MIINKADYKTTFGDYQVHFHSGYEIILVTDGEALVTVGESEYLCKRGSLILISNHEEHSVTVLKKPYIRYYAILNQIITDKALSDGRLLSPLKNRPAGFSHVLNIADSITGFERIFKGFVSDDKNAPFYEELAECRVKELIIMIVRRETANYRVKGSTVKDEIYEIQKYIDVHFAENIRIDAVAERFFINKYYLCHRFKEVTGYSPKQYLRLCRLSLSKALLINSGMPVSEVAQSCGFPDVSNFIRAFKEQYRITPGAYRQQNVEV